MLKIIKKIIRKIISLIIFPLKFLISKDNIIILQTYDPNLYCENTKFLYEYLSQNSNLKVYWVTSNDKISEYLAKNKLEFINIKKNFLKYFLVTLKARIIIDSGTNFFNPFNITSNRTIKITTGHGHGPKDVTTPEIKEKEINELNQFNYVNYAADFAMQKIGRENFKVNEKKLINLGYPRCDQFYNNQLVSDKYKKKEIANYLANDQVNAKSKIILYTPTWRPYPYVFPMNNLKNINFEFLDDFLEKNNIYFFYSFHMVNEPDALQKRFNRIIYIDRKKFNFYDTSSFLCEVDILINDCATTSIDFSLLKRPQIFFFPDYEKYNQKKGFIGDYKEIMPGKEFSTFEEMLSLILFYLKEPQKYTHEFSDKVSNLTKNYYNKKEGNSCLDFKKFIEKVLKNKI